ncbi:MAG: hypothetical protein R2827_07155 [Bdellovibrionales bacterium]
MKIRRKKALVGILMALSVVGWVMLARVVRGQVLQVKQMTYVEASSHGGQGDLDCHKTYFPEYIGPDCGTSFLPNPIEYSV